MYSREFPHRRLPDGRHVATYPELLEYLVAKAPHRVCIAELPFPGPKNKVLYTLPRSHTGHIGCMPVTNNGLPQLAEDGAAARQ